MLYCAVSLVPGSPASVSRNEIDAGTPLQVPVPVPTYVSKFELGGLGTIAGSSVQLALVRFNRWKLFSTPFADQLISSRLGSSFLLQCSSNPWVTRVDTPPMGVKILPPPVIRRPQRTLMLAVEVLFASSVSSSEAA